MPNSLAHVPAGQFPQSSSEDFCYEPWNLIPGRSRRSPDNPQRFARSPDNPQRLARWGDNTHQLVRSPDNPQRFARSPNNTHQLARSPDNPQRFARSPDNPHQLVRWGDRPQSFMGWVAPLNSPMGGWVMADTPNPGIKMAGLIAHVPSRGQLPRSPGGSS